SKLNHSVEPEELMAYLDGEFPAQKAFDTAAHLEHCGECRMLAAELKEVSEMVVGWQGEGTKEGVAGPMGGELGEEKEGESARPLLRQWALFRLPTGRQVLWGSATAVVVLIIFAISIPNLQRNRKLADRAAQLAREGDKTEYSESHRGVQGGGRGSAGKL